MAKFLKNNLSIRSYRSLLCAYTVFNTFRLSLSLFNLYLLVFSSSMLSLVLFYLNCLPLISVLIIVNLFVKKLSTIVNLFLRHLSENCRHFIYKKGRKFPDTVPLILFFAPLVLVEKLLGRVAGL